MIRSTLTMNPVFCFIVWFVWRWHEISNQFLVTGISMDNYSILDLWRICELRKELGTCRRPRWHWLEKLEPPERPRESWQWRQHPQSDCAAGWSRRTPPSSHTFASPSQFSRSAACNPCPTPSTPCTPFPPVASRRSAPLLLLLWAPPMYNYYNDKALFVLDWWPGYLKCDGDYLQLRKSHKGMKREEGGQSPACRAGPRGIEPRTITLEI